MVGCRLGGGRGVGWGVVGCRLGVVGCRLGGGRV